MILSTLIIVLALLLSALPFDESEERLAELQLEARQRSGIW